MYGESVREHGGVIRGESELRCEHVRSLLRTIQGNRMCRSDFTRLEIGGQGHENEPATLRINAPPQRYRNRAADWPARGILLVELQVGRN